MEKKELEDILNMMKSESRRDPLKEVVVVKKADLEYILSRIDLALMCIDNHSFFAEVDLWDIHAMLSEYLWEKRR